MRIGEVTAWFGHFERVAAMNAGLGLGLGPDSHAGQGTRHGLKSVPVSGRPRTFDVSQNTWRAIQSNIEVERRFVLPARE